MKISWSQMRTYSQCRMQHYWRYEKALRPKREKIAPSRGSAGHRALAAYYRREPWRLALKKWLEEQIEKQELFDDEIEEFERVVEDVKNIIPRYIATYAEEEAGWTIIAVEREFAFPVPGTRGDLIFHGYADLVVKDSNGHNWVIEHKFPQRSFKKPDRVELDPQLVLYQKAMQKTLGIDIHGAKYNQILWKLPKEPSINKDGSVSRANIKTDWPTYRKALIEAGESPAEYQDMKKKLANKRFFKRHDIYRGKVAVENFMQDLNRRAREVVDQERRVFMSGSSSFLCPGCDYRKLCETYIEGGDLDFIIEREYEHRERGR